MTQLFRRVVRVAVAPKTEGSKGTLAAIEGASGFDLSGLDCVFKVKKTLKAEPNTCSLRIYNLAASTRRVLEGSKKLTLRLEAGYPGTVGQLFLGEIARASTERDGTDMVTKIETGDSEKEIQASRLSLTIGPKVPASVALTAIAKSLGVGLGNVGLAAAKLAAAGKTLYGPGTILTGSSAQLLTDFCRSADLEWSIQDGMIQILDRAKALDGMAVELSPETGLVGSPSVDHEGIVTAKALIQSDLIPGRKVSFDSLSFKGGYKIQEVEYLGDTSGQDWYAKLQCRKY